MAHTQYTIDDAMKKLIEHDGRFDAHDKRFDAHDGQFDLLARKMLEHDKRFDAHDGQFDLLAQKMLEHDEKFDEMRKEMVTRKEWRELMNTVDTILKLMQKRDQEMTFTTHGMRRHDDRIEKLEEDTQRMKPLLGLT